MRYDQGYGRHGGWQMRMPDGGRGFDRGYPDPRRGGDPADRPWVGGYREGYQGGSGGYALRTTGPLYESPGGGRPEHERGYRRPRGQEGKGRQGGGYFVRARAGYGGDFGGRGGGYTRGFGGGMQGGGGYGRDFGGSARAGGYGGGMQGGGGYGRDYAGGGRSGGYGPDYDRGMRGGGNDWTRWF